MLSSIFVVLSAATFFSLATVFSLTGAVSLAGAFSLAGFSFVAAVFAGSVVLSVSAFRFLLGFAGAAEGSDVGSGGASGSDLAGFLTGFLVGFSPASDFPVDFFVDSSDFSGSSTLVSFADLSPDSSRSSGSPDSVFLPRFFAGGFACASLVAAAVALRFLAGFAASSPALSPSFPSSPSALSPSPSTSGFLPRFFAAGFACASPSSATAPLRFFAGFGASPPASSPSFSSSSSSSAFFFTVLFFFGDSSLGFGPASSTIISQYHRKQQRDPLSSASFTIF